MTRLFDPVTLKLFVAVCEERNIGRAAEREAIVPSAISKRIAALEDDIGAPLLVRARRGIEITAAGQALLRQAREILAMMERAQIELAEFTRGVVGSVRVLASLSALSEYLPDDVARFLAQYRSVRVTLEERVTTEIVRGVREGRADFGVCWDAGDLAGLAMTRYRTDRLCLIVHPDHPLACHPRLAFADTLDHEHVDVLPGGIVQTMLKRFAAIEGGSLRYRVQVSTMDAAARIVAANLGVAVLPREAVGPLAHALGLRLVELSDAWALRQFVICTRADAPLSATARLLVAHLEERAQQGSGALADASG